MSSSNVSTITFSDCSLSFSDPLSFIGPDFKISELHIDWFDESEDSIRWSTLDDFEVLILAISECSLKDSLSEINVIEEKLGGLDAEEMEEVMKKYGVDHILLMLNHY